MSHSTMKILLLSGGVGGAKMAEGLYHSEYGNELSVIGNVADDMLFHGLWVSPDIDTLTYTLADLIDTKKGWGLKDETTNTLEALERLGCDTWMYLGDKDFATHIYRTQQKQSGIRPSVIAKHIAKQLGVTANILLPTDQVIQNRIHTEQGWLDFQSYFVKKGCQPEILDIFVSGIEDAQPTPESLKAINEADLIIIAPSNPIVSINPIVNVPGIRAALKSSKAPVVAVSPMINGKTVKGPADRMMAAMNFSSDVLGVANCYQGLIDGFVIDIEDQQFTSVLEASGLKVMVAQTLMKNRIDKVSLAENVVAEMSTKFGLKCGTQLAEEV
ncbi:2-phospho-L-lactate transferase [Colwellia psychrerythraea]|nr:2-phospho-L-lactate transferase [Colwellia psychrerythraea]